MTTPITLITGPLGSGKTTLLQQILQQTELRLAVVINEFGELGIDGKLIQGKHIQLTELSGGCVCCSLIGEFEAAVEELINTVAPAAIVVETTGVAEPEALLFDVGEALPQTRIDGVVTVMDADALLVFPELGTTSRLQVEAADLIILNKIDLIVEDQLPRLQTVLYDLNPRAPIIPTRHGQVDSNLLFGLTHQQPIQPPRHSHQPDYEVVTFRSENRLRQDDFQALVQELDPSIYRAKGWVRFPEGSYLFNYVNGRWHLDPMEHNETALVFIGRELKSRETSLLKALKTCEIRR